MQGGDEFFQRRLGDAIAVPVGALHAVLAVQTEDDARVGACLQQFTLRLEQPQRRGQVHLQPLQPAFRRVVNERAQATANRRQMNLRVQLAVVFRNHFGEAGVGVVAAAPQVKRHQGVVAAQIVVERFERERVEVEQQQVIAFGVERAGKRFANAAAGAGEQDGFHGSTPKR